MFLPTNKHSDACIYLPPCKLDVLKIVEYKFSCEMEAHVEVTTSLMFDCNTSKDKRHLLILVAISAGRSLGFSLSMFVSDICNQTSNISDYGVEV